MAMREVVRGREPVDTSSDDDGVIARSEVDRPPDLWPLLVGEAGIRPTVVLGNQAGPARLSGIAAAAGFTRIREAARTPFNIVLEARP